MAAAKKDFSNVNTKGMYRQIAEATATEQLPGQYELQQDGSIKEAKKKPQAKKTQEAKKATKTERINLALEKDIYDYIKIASTLENKTMTDFISETLREKLEANRANFEKIKSLNLAK